jgi:glucose-6-phosphate isomerase
MSEGVGNSVSIDWLSGAALSGRPVQRSAKRLSQIKNLFLDLKSAAALDPETVVYRVEYWLPVKEGTSGGLFWGTTVVEPGTVGDEFFMTHGHFHANRDRAEFYATVRGQGALILMDESGHTRFEAMQPGSLHYIPGRVAHRVANTGHSELAFVGCWPSDAGHDYDVIRRNGFGARLRAVNGAPVLIPDSADEKRSA